MAELRWNPLLNDWTIVASNRQNRPYMPQNWCPFCTDSGKVPQNYEVHKYDNDFPALSQEPPIPDNVGSSFYKAEEAYGKCEVILYSPKHDVNLWELTREHVRKLVDLWCERFIEISKDERIKYIYIFENRGEEVGVTMPHPHGQIYAYSQMPLKIQTELNSCRCHYEETGECLICRMNMEEKQFNGRIIFENKDFLCYLPFFTDYPYGLFIVSKAHKGKITDFTEGEKDSLANMLIKTVGTFDMLYDRPFPYMMCMHQEPVNSPGYGDSGKYYHFHIEFYPPLWSDHRIKYYASSEMGAWAACNPKSVEETAMELREAYKKFSKIKKG
ncbi:Galactose-1-phosphate uridylyltransferase [bioreactor metagenome]|uniref:UDP-glucose--hexose-1-phosphate uridylyltransferase n=1 Tax=bioreactor metagenome TaxID=1076179 RepID=A0A645C2P2_9ZZZZ|nr:galactose-1-phosphate uridylyltransferase [Lutispora sp.]MEA4960921.1 galactose-1-phosphate uridylyltransferase [Lutispora sp.]HCJ58801.1 galactose-1-phosphate uridylyltransferase [Clostridiaceae bacterium]